MAGLTEVEAHRPGIVQQRSPKTRAQADELLAGVLLDDRDVDARQRELARQHQPLSDRPRQSPLHVRSSPKASPCGRRPHGRRILEHQPLDDRQRQAAVADQAIVKLAEAKRRALLRRGSGRAAA